MFYHIVLITLTCMKNLNLTLLIISGQLFYNGLFNINTKKQFTLSQTPVPYLLKYKIPSDLSLKQLEKSNWNSEKNF